jgi:hypothetical protein
MTSAFLYDVCLPVSCLPVRYDVLLPVWYLATVATSMTSGPTYTMFSKIDLVKGYYQIPVAAADIPKTVIITPFGLFEYLFTPLGLSNIAQTFQRMMDCTTDDLEGVFAYMDNSRVSSLDRQTHLLHLEAFFNAPATNGLAINLEK